MLAYTTPTTGTDHIVGLRFAFEPKVPTGAATLGANTFSGTQTAPAFVGNGSGLTGLPFPAGAATLGANTFAGTQTAPAFAGSGASLTDVAKLGANTFTGTQTIGAGNLDLGASTVTTGNLTKNGVRFLHSVGTSNVFLGEIAGNLAMTGAQNTGIGAAALEISSHENAAVGNTALPQHRWRRTRLGSSADSRGQRQHRRWIECRNLGRQDRTTSTWERASLANAGESNTMYLGNGQTRTFISGIRSVTTGAANAIPVVIDSNGQLGTVSSSIRFKEDVHDMADVSHRLLQLRPVTFRYTQAYRDGAKPIQYGLIAEEVADVFPELAVRGADGQVETVHYETLNVLLLNEFQKQAGRLEAIERQLNELLRERTAGH